MKTIFISLLITMFFVANAFAQGKGSYQSITLQHHHHSVALPSCVSASLIVSYSLNGTQYSVMGNSVVANAPAPITIGVGIPAGAVVLNKVIHFSTSSGDYFNHVAGSSNQVYSNATNSPLCGSGPTGYSRLLIVSTTTNLVVFGIGT